VDPANRCGMAVLADRVSFALHLLAEAKAMGRARRVAEGLAGLSGSAG
jgi:hypothetical protein